MVVCTAASRGAEPLAMVGSVGRCWLTYVCGRDKRSFAFPIKKTTLSAKHQVFETGKDRWQYVRVVFDHAVNCYFGRLGRAKRRNLARGGGIGASRSPGADQILATA